MSTAAWEFRQFVAESDGTVHLSEKTVSRSLDAAMDVLMDAGMSLDHFLPTVLAAEQDGMDPEQFARKLVRLSKAARGG